MAVNCADCGKPGAATYRLTVGRKERAVALCPACAGTLTLAQLAARPARRAAKWEPQEYVEADVKVRTRK
ncbi:hypothetical protein [Streptomyces hydrogenans]|uniref:hypothetical protein n=1 Tax=Streptomyces hydrogenans TaxID=1873719 RepID=UPI0035DF2128